MEDTVQYTEEIMEFQALKQERKVCITLPTYNEAGNIKKVLDLLFYYHGLQYYNPLQLNVLVIDDNSPDGTASVVREYKKSNPNVHLLLRREKQGLGAAYIAGMRYALARLNPEVIVEMDADLQHNPFDVFRLVDSLDETTDFVIGSRYIDGGRIPPEWGLRRKITSSLANLATKMILNPGGIKDCTGGFRAIKADFLRQIDLKKMGVKGYAFQAALLEAALRSNRSVKEIPITFYNRTVGKSKMKVRDMVEGVFFLMKLRIERMLSRKNGHKNGHATLNIKTTLKKVYQ